MFVRLRTGVSAGFTAAQAASIFIERRLTLAIDNMDAATARWRS